MECCCPSVTISSSITLSDRVIELDMVTEGQQHSIHNGMAHHRPSSALPNGQAIMQPLSSRKISHPYW